MPVTETQAGEAPYTFGDTEIAAQRLELLARVFAGSTRAYLDRAVPWRTGLVVDLGCGPGFSTLLLAEHIRSDHVVGLDNSTRFIAMARSRATERVSFRLHDFSVLPFPVGPAELLYARFELSHVREPQAVVQRWATQLRPGGLLLMEETEWIRTSQPTFARYLQIVEAMLASQSSQLYVGSALNEIPDTALLVRRGSDIGLPSVNSQDAAAMFFLNIQTWKQNRFIQAHYSTEEIAQLEGDLEALTRRPGSTTEIEWGLRQLVFERTG